MKPTLYLQRTKVRALTGEYINTKTVNFGSFLTERIESAPQGALFVLTDINNGKALIYCLESSAIAKRGDISVTASDTFTEKYVDIAQVAVAIKQAGATYKTDFLAQCSLMQADSLALSNYFENESVYQVSLGTVTTELLTAWWQNIAPNGYLHGFDLIADKKTVVEFAEANGLDIVVVDTTGWCIRKGAETTEAKPKKVKK